MAPLRTRSLLLVVVVGYMVLAFQFISRDTTCPIIESGKDYGDSLPPIGAEEVNRDDVGPIAAPQQVQFWRHNHNHVT